MEETEDEIDSNLILSSPGKKIKSKSSKNNCILRRVRYHSKEKFQMDSIQKIFNQGITSNQPVKMIFTSNNIIKPLPIVSSIPNNNNNNDYLIINEEMKINKNIFENNLFNLLEKEKTKKKITNRNLFSSFLKESSINILKKNDEKEQDSVASEEQKSVESYSGKAKGATSPSSNGEIKRKNASLVNKNNNLNKKYKLKYSSKSHKKKISLIKMLNKPICFISSKGRNDNFSSEEVRKLNFNRNLLINNEQKTINNRYNNINVINHKNLDRVSYYKVNHIYNERVRSGLINIYI